jgi:NitT/TauT family transport system substrate-binding protein
MKKPLALILALTFLLTACAPAAAPPPTAAPTPALRNIRLPMGYIPSVQYANFYVAVEKGYFAAEGIALEFDYSFETNGVQLVGANELPFAVVSGEQVLLARAQGLRVKYVMAWFQKFPVAVMSKAEAGLRTPADLRGKTIGVPTLDGANFIGLHALLAAEGIPAAEVNIEAIGFNQVEALNAGQVDAAVVYSNNEPIRLAAQGQKLNVIQVSDYAALAANGILTNEETLAKDPALVRGFLRALIKGTQDVIRNPDEAYTITKKFVPELKDDAVEKQVLAATIELWKANTLGQADAQAWQNMNATLLDSALLTTQLDVNQAFTNEFLP